ncbi:MAG: exodeoxyribonuclease VII large subunit, partial [Alphaproteobacteria bacterium]|nr:exodeoxyribonuclease VII large subunit [Alphaproteobacteria bacterium]
MIEQIPEFSVSEISAVIKKLVETTFQSVRVRGEIFGCKRADSGHYYMSLKDENAVLSAVCWKGVAMSLPVKPEDGLEIVATGRITTFAGKSSYQLVIEKMEVAGSGALLKLLEERKKKFADEGLFDAAHKKQIPYLPQIIGVVTSPTGAVIRDIIHRVRDRFPCRIIVWPTLVQGEGAAEQISAAIDGFNALTKDGDIPRPDVLIVARGGGSLEDLWCFNEENVVRAVYNSEIPIISAVGHETDTMLIDYAADLRAPTPTGAAEFAVPVKSEIVAKLMTQTSRMINAVHRLCEEKKNYLEGLARGIPNLEQILGDNVQKLDEKVERLKLAFGNYLSLKENVLALSEIKPIYIENIMTRKKEALSGFAARLESVSVESVLQRGFAWVKTEQGKTIYNKEQALKKHLLQVTFADGNIKVRTMEKKDELQGD